MKIIAYLLLASWALIAQAVMAITPDQWREDIKELDELVETQHPDPFTKISRAEFEQRANQLGSEIHSLTEHQIIVEMMRLVASIGDGHSTLHPSKASKFDHWFPLSFYAFANGVFVVSAHSKYQDLIGVEIVGVGGTPIDVALEKASSLIGADNDTGRSQNIFYLGSGDALLALGVIDEAQSLPLNIIEANGRRRTVEVEAMRTEFVLDETRFWGEMYAPFQGEVLREFVLSFDALGLADYSKKTVQEKDNLPLHVRDRRAYWSTYLPDRKTVYMQINHITSSGRGEFESFEQFYSDAFETVRRQPVETFILDLRYNSGGDGSILIPFVHQFVRNEAINRKGHLFTLVGRKSFSAAIMLLDLMMLHTETLIVGEPPGAPLNSYGDPRTYKLKNSQLNMDLSSEYWKLVHSASSPPLTPIDIPAVFTSGDYFSGRDPAIDSILSSGVPYRTLEDALRENGGPSTRDRYGNEKQAFGRFTWWHPFDESEFRKVARGLVDDGKTADGIIGFEILVDAFPNSWRAWRDFGKAQLIVGDRQSALQKLLKAQAINRGDSEVNELIARLSESD